MIIPKLVHAAQQRAERAGFAMSCDPAVGRLLGVLAAAVPPGGRVLEMGTGAGVGTAWLAEGLAGRRDVTIISVEIDPGTAAVAQAGEWPATVTLVVGDVLDLLADLGDFDLIFSDAQGGKWHGLDRTIAALRPGGLVVVDDMCPAAWMNEEHPRRTAEVRESLLGHPGLAAVELAWASGVILAAKRYP